MRASTVAGATYEYIPVVYRSVTLYPAAEQKKERGSGVPSKILDSAERIQVHTALSSTSLGSIDSRPVEIVPVLRADLANQSNRIFK